MSPHPLSKLLERTLVIVAHPDDECIGSGALLQQMRSALVVFCTDGAPRDRFFWQAFSNREQYAQIRRDEGVAAAEAVGIIPPIFLPIIDQELYLNLCEVHEALEKVIVEFHPDAILTLAYEGGHPDHDCCAFLGHVLASEHNLTVWETPLYHRTSEGARRQEFLIGANGATRLQVHPHELARKRAMAASYKSQASVVESFDLQLELFRSQAQYDFSRPPVTDVINYEFWQWPVTARALCDTFSSFEQKSVAKSPANLKPEVPSQRT